HKWVGQSGRTGKKQSGRAGGRTTESSERQNATVQQNFQNRRLQHYAVIVDAVSSTHHGAAMAERIPGEAEAWSEVLVLGRGVMRTDDVANVLTIGDARSQVGTWIVLVGFAQDVKVHLPAQSKVERQVVQGLPIILHKQSQVS